MTLTFWAGAYFLQPVKDIGFEVFAFAGPFLFLGQDADAFLDVAEEYLIGAKFL